MPKNENSTAIANEIETRKRFAGIQAILREYCSNDVDADIAYRKLNEILKFDDFALRFCV